MKIGTDGVLLGAWAELGRANGNVLDVGAGCGVIALMLAQRYAQASITAVELDAEAMLDLRANIEASPWANRVQAIESDYKAVDGHYDLIVSNPPFFITGERAPQSARAAARHIDHGLSPIALTTFAAEHLSDGGRLAMIFPIEQLAEVEFHAALHHLSPLRTTEVLSNASRQPLRVLAEFAKANCPCLRSRLIIHDDAGGYSPEYISLTRNFYLHL